jgi:3-deoxy-7-phosphoheptulonate synthase
MLWVGERTRQLDGAHVEFCRGEWSQLFGYALSCINSTFIIRNSKIVLTSLGGRPGVGNPLGVKVSDKCTPDELLEIIDALNPGEY